MTEQNSIHGVTTPKDLRDLKTAVALLEQNSFTEQLTSIIGKFVGEGMETGVKLLPQSAQDMINDAAHSALTVAFEGALRTVDRDGTGLTGLSWLDEQLSSSWLNKALVTSSGMVGGLFGLVGTTIELPITTGLLMRSIADTARSQGEDLTTDESKAECLKIFALGGYRASDDDATSGYYATRIALSRAIPKAAEKTIASFLPKLIAEIVPKFGIPVSIKVSSEAIPGIGAVAGGLINLAFVTHFQDKARGHFTVRRLEREYGAAAVQSAYAELRAEWLASKAAKRPQHGKARAAGVAS